jgi:hypothetical protein
VENISAALERIFAILKNITSFWVVPNLLELCERAAVHKKTSKF